MTKCKRCGDYIVNNNGKCNCEPFGVYYPEYYGEEKEIVYGFTHEDVVEKVARKINQDDYIYDVDIFEPSIIVTDKNDVEKSFNCIAEVDVIYHVREIYDIRRA